MTAVLAALDVGIAGAGRMGVPIITRLLELGHRVRFYDPDPAAGPELDRLGGIRVAGPAELGGAAISVSLVTDGRALLGVLLGPAGLAAAARPGHVHVSMSTVGPDVIREIEAGAPGLLLLDAPVSGSVSFARNGELTMMVGASPENYDIALPFLRQFTRMQFLVGPLGAGSALKLAVNTAVASTNHAIAEVIVLAEAYGIAPAAAYDVLLASVVSSPFVHYKRSAFLEPSTAVEGSVRMVAKDLDLALGSAADAGVELPGATFARDVLAATADHGLADADVAAVLRWLRDLQPAKGLRNGQVRTGHMQTGPVRTG